MLTPAAHLTCVAATRAGGRRGDRRLRAGRRAPHRGAARRSDRRRRRALRAASRRLSATPPISSPASSASPTSKCRSPPIRRSIRTAPTSPPTSTCSRPRSMPARRRAITQFFFENDALFPLSRPRARERHRHPDRAGHPAGAELQADRRISPRAAGASVPAWLAERFDGLDDDPATRKLIAAAVAAEQVLDLVDHGVTDFHFYTMNRADLCLRDLPPARACARRSRAGALASSPRRRLNGHNVMTIRPDQPRRPCARLAAERILVLDGAMGTMIQALGLDEQGYRGARFDAWNREVRGNNDLLNLSRPDCGARHPPRLFPRRRRHRLDQHLLLDPHRAGRLRHGRDRLRAQPRRRAARARGGAGRPGRRRPPALRRRRHRPDQPHRLDLARRAPTRASAPSPSTSCASPTPNRCAA